MSGKGLWIRRLASESISIVVLLAIGAAGCTTIEGATTWDITLRNDTESAVVVKDCFTSACDRFRYTKRVPARGSVAATDHGDGRTWWLVMNARGRRLGCMTLNYTQRVEGYVLRLSRVTSCPETS